MIIGEVARAMWNSELGDSITLFFGIISFSVACLWIHRRVKLRCLTSSAVSPPPFDVHPYVCFTFGITTLSALALGLYWNSPILQLLFYFQILSGMMLMAFIIRSDSPFGWQRLDPVELLIIGFIGAGAVYTATSFIGLVQQLLADQLHITLEEQGVVKDFQVKMKNLNAEQIAETLLGAAIFAPFCEELFFRGFLYTALKKCFTPWPAMILSGLTFGLIHWNANAFLPLTFLGACLALVYETTGSLAASVAIHGFFNLFTCLFLLYQVKYS